MSAGAVQQEINPAQQDAKMENGTATHDHAGQSVHQRKPYDYGGNPLMHVNTGESVRLQAFGGELQPGLYKSTKQRKFANPAPLGLSAFALTTFVLSLINLGTRGIPAPSLVIGAAFGYGGLVQLLAGMWEMAVGNTFGATALSSYGGFWIAVAIILTPGGFEIESTLTIDGTSDTSPFANSFGLFLMGWFIFTFILLLCTLRSTVAFFTLFFTLDMAFLFLGLGYLYNTAGAPDEALIKTGGAFGIIAAFAAWYNALAGIADTSNSFFIIPVAHFPWGEMRDEEGVACPGQDDVRVGYPKSRQADAAEPSKPEQSRNSQTSITRPALRPLTLHTRKGEDMVPIRASLVARLKGEMRDEEGVACPGQDDVRVGYPKSRRSYTGPDGLCTTTVCLPAALPPRGPRPPVVEVMGTTPLLEPEAPVASVFCSGDVALGEAGEEEEEVGMSYSMWWWGWSAASKEPCRCGPSWVNGYYGELAMRGGRDQIRAVPLSIRLNGLEEVECGEPLGR
nr:acetate permease a [Quercus suber]